MKKSSAGFLSLFVIIFLFSGFVFGPAPVEKDYNFSLKDYNGKVYNLSDYKDSKAIVVMFIATECPVSNAYNTRMVQLYKEFEGKGVTILGINSNKQEDINAIKEHASKNGFKFPVLKDPGNKIADNYGATVTPEVYILSNKLELLYHGRIDDSRSEDGVKSRDAANALNEILSGKKVTVAETKAFGCTIKKIS